MTDAPRTAIVTGAAQGVGEAAARRLALEGFGRLLLIDRNAEAVEAVAASVDGAEALVLDLTDVEALIRRVGATAERLGPVHALVNAAGSTARGGLRDVTPATFDMLMALNVRAPLFAMQVVTPHMPPGGVVVNIASFLAHGGPPFLLAYATSKAAIGVMTRNAANTLKHDGVRVHAINLGWTVTPAERITQRDAHGLPDDWPETVGATQPFGRLLTPEDPAALIAFLASPGGAMMTGAVIDMEQHVLGTADDNAGNL